MAYCFEIMLFSINMLSVVRQFALKPNCNGSDFSSIIFVTVKREFKIDSKILPNTGMTHFSEIISSIL